ISAPSGSANDGFGVSIATATSTRVLIGASGRTVSGITRAGVVYVIDDTNAVVATASNPSPGATDRFGDAVAAYTSTEGLVGEPLGDTATPDVGTLSDFRL